MPGGHWTMKMDVVAMSTARHTGQIAELAVGRRVGVFCGVAALRRAPRRRRPPPAPVASAVPPKLLSTSNNNEVVRTIVKKKKKKSR